MHNYSQKVKTVSQITNGLKNLLEQEYRFVHITGEISNLRTPYSGHSYFILKDENAQIRGVLFKGQKRYLEKSLKDGQQIICHGRISVYGPRGEYQLIIDTIDFSGTGLLREQFEQLKRKLEAEGLFDTSTKKPIPKHPKTIVIVTSPTGAALQDFLKLHSLRMSNCNVMIYPVSVQGDNAAPDMISAIKTINSSIDTDAIVLCRGGGSIEDLFSYNDEKLARAIFASKVPIISAVGHEIDFTISDFCSDHRCPTPTAAAEFLFPDNSELTDKVMHLNRRLIRTIQTSISQKKASVSFNIRLLGDLKNIFQQHELRIDLLISGICQNVSFSLNQKQNSFDLLQSKLSTLSPQTQMVANAEKISYLSDKLSLLMKHKLKTETSRLAQTAGILDSVSPLATLSRGYSIVQKEGKTGKTKGIVSKTSQVSPSEHVDIKLSDGSLCCEVLEIIKE